MSKRNKIVFAVFASILLLAGTAFAFPYDPNPSTINNSPVEEGGFPGDWGNTLRSLNVDQLRVLQFMINEFKTTGGGPGGAADLKIWNTPAFEPNKVREDERSWNYLLDHPGAAVPAEHGRSLYTTHDELVEFIEKLPRTNLTVEYLGEIPRGFPFPFLVFSKNSDRTPAGLAATGKPLVWIQGNNHGGEWSGGEGALCMAYDLANGRYDHLLDKVNVLIVPRICADGAKRPHRQTNDLVALQWTSAPSGRDLNRDNMLLDLQVLRTMRKMFIAYAPHFCCDLHERGATNINLPGNNQNSTQYTTNIQTIFGLKIDNNAHDIGASGTILPQATKELISLRYQYMEPDLAEMGRKYGLYFGFYSDPTDPYGIDSTSANLGGTVNNYSTGGAYVDAGFRNNFVTQTAFDPDAPYFVIPEAQYNTRTANNITAMMGTVTQLFENKAGPTNVGNRGNFERRVAAGYVCMLSAITTAANRPEVLEKILEIRNKNVEKGKTVTADDMIPILAIQPKPTYVMDREWTVIDISADYTPENARDQSNILRYDGTKALRRVPDGTGVSGSNYAPAQGNGTRDHQFFKTEVTWQSVITRERIRPYAYIFEGAQANELATRMMLAGIHVKRLAEDVTVDVEGWSYNKAPVVDTTDQGSSGWRNRDVRVYPISNRTFKKDAFVVYLAQAMCNLIPMYIEPDIPWSVGSCIYLPPMSAALGGASNGWLSEQLVGVEMPMYRYLTPVDLPTYDVDHFHPLINRGAVNRFFNYHTQEETAAVAVASGKEYIKVFDYDIQAHTRTDALVGNKFDITLPTSANNAGYLILRNDGTYEPLTPHSDMFGWDVATVEISRHGLAPFTIDMDPSTGRPRVAEGDSRALPRALPATDDLIGVRIVEVFNGPIDPGKEPVLPPEPEPFEPPLPEDPTDPDPIDPTDPVRPPSSGGGCSAGYAVFALLAVCPMFVMKKR